MDLSRKGCDRENGGESRDSGGKKAESGIREVRLWREERRNEESSDTRSCR